MKHTIEILKNPLTYIDNNNKKVSVIGYCFKDETNGTIIIVYGENRRDFISKHLSGNTNELKLKYNIIS
jgi:hypothetical protein